jgi:AcrR family transcriptional regulator
MYGVAMRNRPLRADARLNEDRLLEAAAEAFNRDGSQATLKDIAKAAGVGIGTLYRRFPTRERLVEATYRNEVARVCAAAPKLLAQKSAKAALRAWMDRFLDFMATKEGMAETLRVVLTDSDEIMETRQLLADAIGLLLEAGVSEKTVRDDVDPLDVLMSLGGTTLIAGQVGQRDLAARLLDLLMAGLEGPVRADGGPD